MNTTVGSGLWTISWNQAGNCVWKNDPDDYDDTIFHSECGLKWIWEFPRGTITENGMNYCPKCGRHLVTIPPTSESDDGD